MAGATFYNKKHLCYVEDTDFTDYQGIGSDPLYKRYDSVSSVVKNHIAPQYQSFLAQPFYDEGLIHWYVDEWKESPVSYKDLQGEEKVKYTRIKEDTISHYKDSLNQLSSDELLIMAGALKYINDEFIYCFDDKVVLVAWGMKPDTSKHIVGGSWVKGFKKEEKFKIRFVTDKNGKVKFPDRAVINRKKGDKILASDIPEVVPNEGYVFSGWEPTNVIGYEVQGETVFTATFSKAENSKPVDVTPEMVTAYFDVNDKGTLNGAAQVSCEKGHSLADGEIPDVAASQGYKFLGWTPDVHQPLNQDTYFEANFEKNNAHCIFLPGDHGKLKGASDFIKPLGSIIPATEIPTVIPHRGYRFTGWDSSIADPVSGDKTYTAQYEKKLPWYKRFWIWLKSFGCLKWLLYILLFCLIAWLLSWLLRGCVGCSGHHGRDVFGSPVLDDDSVARTEEVRGSDGVIRDNNGSIGAITDNDGNLPDKDIVAPIVGEDGEQPPIIHNDGAPDVIANRLNIYFENEKADLDKWAHDFKKAYPSDEYQIIGCDKNVPIIQIQIPESKRDQVREEINKKIPDQEFFVIDESIITLHGHESTLGNSAERGWHLKATHVKEAWSYSKGKPDVIIAIVDDGIDASHKMLKARFFKAYNVFTQNRTLSLGAGHGTHVAGLAAGAAMFYSQGASGVAPNCKIMPVQVFDNGMCTFSTIASGIMYAINNGANVVNISIGPSFPGLDQMPIEQQKQVAETYFKNEEKVYRHIISTANKKNVILVFAAGNDNIMTAVLPECRATNNTVNVAAVTPTFEAAPFSNYSLGTNISAPGVGIYSSYTNNSFKMFDGTSMAAPIVTGAIALMKSLKPNLTVGQALGLMQQNGRMIQNGEYVPPMILIDKCLEAIKQNKIPNGPVWQFKNGGNASESPVRGNVDNASESPVRGNADAGTDNYASLRDKLKQLKQQRDEISRQINLIEKKLK